jgi:hypothetical protein
MCAYTPGPCFDAVAAGVAGAVGFAVAAAGFVVGAAGLAVDVVGFAVDGAGFAVGFAVVGFCV